MTMHLIKGLSDSGSRKPPKQLTEKQKSELKPKWKERNQMLKKMHLPVQTFEEFLDYIQGKPLKVKPKKTTLLSGSDPQDKYYTVSKESGTQGFEPCVMKRNVLDPRVLANEKPEVRDAILAKSRRTMPLYNKGSYQYVTDGEDVTTLGSRSRR